MGAQRKTGARLPQLFEFPRFGPLRKYYADFAPQVEAVTGATLRDEAFFNQTVESVL